MDPYDVIGVDETATKAEILRAYKRIARQCHPDKNPSQTKEATERFQYLTECVNKLMNPETRASIDKARRIARNREMEKRDLNAKRARLIDELERRERECENPKKPKPQHREKRPRRNFSPPPEELKPDRGIGYVRLKTKWSMEPEKVRDIFKQYGQVLRVMSTNGDYIVSFNRFEDALKAVLTEKANRNGVLVSVKLVEDIVEAECRVDVADDFDEYEASILYRMANYEG